MGSASYCGKLEVEGSGTGKVKALVLMNKDELTKAVTLLREAVATFDGSVHGKVAYLVSMKKRDQQMQELVRLGSGVPLEPTFAPIVSPTAQRPILQTVVPRPPVPDAATELRLVRTRSDEAWDAWKKLAERHKEPVPEVVPEVKTVSAYNPNFCLETRSPRVHTGKTSPWKGCFMTSAEDHNKELVSSMAYTPGSPGALSDRYNLGWLVSTSAKVINLWECTSDSKLELKHSQFTNYLVECIDVNPRMNVLISVGMSTKTNQFSIYLHDLSAATLFQPKETIPLATTGAPLNGAPPQIPGVQTKLHHLCSLHTFDGALQECVAVSVVGTVQVIGLKSSAKAPKASWQAHDYPITAMHRSDYNPRLFTGASNGSVKMWDMRSRPPTQVREFKHSCHMTGLTLVDANVLCGSGADGFLQFWDTRSGCPIGLGFAPDTKPILNLSAAGKLPNSLAFTTRGGVFSFEFVGGTSGVTPSVFPLQPLPATGPCTQLEWNPKSMLVYAACPGGNICVYRKVQNL